MNDTAEYLLLLAISIGLTFAVGRLLVTAGEPFLQDVFQDRKVSRSVNLLLSVLFHLITLGVLAIVSVIDLDTGSRVQTLVAKLGVVLLILGIAYGISMLVLIRIRDRRRAAQISEHVQERLADRGFSNGPAQATPQMPANPQPGNVAPQPGYRPDSGTPDYRVHDQRGAAPR